MTIEKFVPPRSTRNEDGLDCLLAIHDNFQYTSRGRWALYHCLKANNIISGNVLLPSFACETILEPIKTLGLNAIFYDIDLEDLNPSIKSIRENIFQNNIKAAVIVSMYGNPANLVEIERLLKKHKILMIDDAAQAFGAYLNNKYVGAFGDAGFFSFSPGKSTVAHMGAFFWTKKPYTFNHANNHLIHYLIYFEFYFNRYEIYKYSRFRIFKLFKIIRILLKIFDVKNDKINQFEKEILGGVLYDLFNKKFEYRNDFITKLSPLFEGNKKFRLIKAVRGEPHMHKVVIVAASYKLAASLFDALIENDIYVQYAYAPLSDDLKKLKNLRMLNKKILEVPIDPFEKKRTFLYEVLKKIMENFSEHA